MKLTILGTGHAFVTECYNTCFVLEEKGEYLLVDGGGGAGLFRQLKYAGIDWKKIKTIFVTHKHMDHVMGILWMIRMICDSMSVGAYEGDVTIYAHAELADMLLHISRQLLQENSAKFLGNRLKLVAVSDQERLTLLGHSTVFFDIGSTKAKQFGFTMSLDGKEKLTCCGDEPCGKSGEKFAAGSKWLLHEAFCLFSESDRFRPYEKHHSTVKDACQTAERLGVENLLLYHTEDSDIERRKMRYHEEGSIYYHGNLYIPDDLETLEL